MPDLRNCECLVSFTLFFLTYVVKVDTLHSVRSSIMNVPIAVSSESVLPPDWRPFREEWEVIFCVRLILLEFIRICLL